MAVSDTNGDIFYLLFAVSIFPELFLCTFTIERDVDSIVFHFCCRF